MCNYWGKTVHSLLNAWMLIVIAARVLAMLVTIDELLGAQGTGRPIWGLCTSLSFDGALVLTGAALLP